ncbi:MAG: S16 family serine protease [Fervidicoccaceae archaeon]
MRKLGFYLFTILIVLAPASATASAPITFNYNYLISIHLPALAVSSEGGGVLTNLTVTIAYPGSGQVYFSSDPVTEMDTQSSARTAVLVAANYLGIDYRKYDYFFSMKSPSLIIGGPSASAVMTVGVVAAILNATVRNDVAMTGMINPDGTIGPVGGIPDKLQAAAQAGYKIFLVPVGQLVVTEQQLISQTTPFGTVYRTVTKTVNLTQLGDSLGVKVKQVTTLGEALSYFLENVSLPSPTLVKVSYTPEQIDLFTQWKTSLEEIYNQSINELNSLMKLYGSSVDKDVVNAYLNQSSVSYTKSIELWQKGMYYSSLSSLYQGDIMLNAAIIYIKTTVNPSLIQTYINSINDTLVNLREKIFNKTVDTFSQLESYLVAMDRLDNALSSLGAAASSIYSMFNVNTGKWTTVLSDPIDLAIANISQFTIQNWLSYGKLSSPSLSSDFLQNIADYYLQYAKSVLTYYQSLASEVNVSTDIQTLNSMYYNAYSTYYSGNYAASIYYSVSTVSRATLDIHVLFNTDIVSIIKAELANTNATIGKTGYVSAVVLGYMEQAENYLAQYSLTNNSNYLYNALTLSLESGIYESLFNLGKIYSGQQTITFTFIPTGSSGTTNQTTTTTTSSEAQSTNTSPIALGDGPLVAIVTVLIVFVGIATYLTRTRKKEKHASEIGATTGQI